jgi:hypothetical protein
MVSVAFEIRLIAFSHLLKTEIKDEPQSHRGHREIIAKKAVGYLLGLSIERPYTSASL